MSKNGLHAKLNANYKLYFMICQKMNLKNNNYCGHLGTPLSKMPMGWASCNLLKCCRHLKLIIDLNKKSYTHQLFFDI